MSLYDMFQDGVSKAVDIPKDKLFAPLPVSGYRFNKLKLDIKSTATKISKLEGEKSLLEAQLTAAEEKQRKAQAQIELIEKVTFLLQTVSDFARQHVKSRVEEIVSQALDVVFGGSNKFTIELRTGKSGPEAYYWLEDSTNKTLLQKPDFSRGGGKIDVISLALRIAVLELSEKPGPLLADEVGKHLDKDAVPNMAYFLKEYAQTFARQTILVTHHEALAEIGDASIHVSKVNGIAQVKNN